MYTVDAEKVMAPHSSTLAWKIPWVEEPGGLQSMGSLGVGHNWATSLSLFTFMHWRRNGNPLQCYCLEDPRDGGAWWAAISGVAQSRTRLKRLSSSSVQLINVPFDKFGLHNLIFFFLIQWAPTLCRLLIYKCELGIFKVTLMCWWRGDLAPRWLS